MALTSQRHDLIQGLRRLELGAVLGLVGIALTFCTVILAFTFTSFILTKPEAPTPGFGLMVLAFMSLALAITSFVFWALAAYSLSRHHSRYKIGWIGVLLQVISIVGVGATIVALMPLQYHIAITSKAIDITSVAFSIMGLIVIFVVLSIVGSILFGVMLMRLPEEQGVDSLFKTAGVMWIVATVLMAIMPFIGVILTLVAEILVFMASRNSLKTLSAS